MGRAKEHWMRQVDEGWRSVGDKHVCSKCLTESAIAKFIKSNASSKTCSYCGRRSRKEIAAEMDEVISFIAQGLQRENEDPANSVNYETAEGGYTLATMDGSEILEDYGLDDCHENLWEDLERAFSDSIWVRKNPYGMSWDEEQIFTWNKFSEQLRHMTRFVFFEVKTDFSSSLGVLDAEPHVVLSHLASAVEELGLLCCLPKGSQILRARQHKPEDIVCSASDIGPPIPRCCIRQNRFSPAGIPMFYGAEDQGTALIETVQLKDSERNLLSVGTFRSSRDLLLLDLTALPKWPSVFDPKNWYNRAPIAFLHHFITEASKSLTSPDAASFEYVPTQVVAEYFRHLFKMPGDRMLDGIKYRSSHGTGGICYTLFLTADDCADKKRKTKYEKKPALILENLVTHPVESLTLPKTLDQLNKEMIGAISASDSL